MEAVERFRLPSAPILRKLGDENPAAAGGTNRGLVTWAIGHIHRRTGNIEEAITYFENAIELGVNGVKNIMRSIDMLKKEPTQEARPIFSREEDWIVAHKGWNRDWSRAQIGLINRNPCLSFSRRKRAASK